MGLLDTEILSNRFDVENSLNNTMTERAQGYGALDRSVYAPMTASTALQGDMAGQAIGGMLGGQQVEMQKQDIIDDIMQRNPDPKTSDELRSVAGEFAKAGLTDYSFQITEVANQLYKTELEKDTATEGWYTGIGKTLENQILTNDIKTMYAKEMFQYSEEDWKELSISDKDRLIGRAEEELKGQIQNYADRKKMDGLSKSNIKKLKSNDALFFQDFYADLNMHGNTKVVNFLQKITSFDSAGGKNTMQINTDLYYKINDTEMSSMGGDEILSAIGILESRMKDRKLNATETDNLKRLRFALDNLDKGDETKVNLEYERIKNEPRFEGRSEEDVKEMIRRTYDITTSSIAPVDDGTMLAMNTQQPDNFSSWIV